MKSLSLLMFLSLNAFSQGGYQYLELEAGSDPKIITEPTIIHCKGTAQPSAPVKDKAYYLDLDNLQLCKEAMRDGVGTGIGRCVITENYRSERFSKRCTYYRLWEIQKINGKEAKRAITSSTSETCNHWQDDRNPDGNLEHCADLARVLRNRILNGKCVQ
jgi:hypothetical protein